MVELKRTTTVLNKQDVTGVMYVNTDMKFQSVSIINPTANCDEQDNWLVGQQWNRLNQGPGPLGDCGKLLKKTRLIFPQLEIC